MTSNISATECIGVAYETVKTNFFKFLSLIIILAGIELISYLFKSSPKPVLLLAKMITTCVIWIFSIGIVRVSIQAVDGKSFDVFDAFTTGIYTLLKCAAAGILYILGIVLCAIPLAFLWAVPFIGGPITFLLIIYFVYTFFFVMYLIVDKDVGPLEAFIESSSITSGEKLNLFVLSILLGLLNIVGVICLVVGLAITIPVSWVAMAYAYRQLAPVVRTPPKQPPTPTRPTIQKSDLAPAPARKPIEVDYT